MAAVRNDPLLDPKVRTHRYFMRALVASLLIVGVLLVLFARLYFLQISKYDHYATASRSNRLRMEVLQPVRGTITDRHGRLLAVNNPTFSLALVPEQVESMPKLLNELGSLVEISDHDLERFTELQERARPFDEVILRSHLSEQERAILAVNGHRFPGVRITAESLRYYPYGRLFAHLVGYVGRLSATDLQQVRAEDYRGARHFGKTSIERTFEKQLRGHNSYRVVERDANGRVLRELQRVKPGEGDSLRLTVDAELQQVAAAALGGEAGAVVALEPGSGAVRAMVSWPAFDPNDFVRGISHSAYQQLLDDRQRPLFNRATTGRYPPGSTLKPFIGLAGLEAGVVDETSREFCPGWFQLEGRERKYRCWHRSGHGLLDLVGAIAQSCDVFFYSLAMRLGVDPIHDYLKRFGFGAKTNIGIGQESAGLLPSSQWKQAALGKPWYPGETVITGIGQGYNEATALQLAKATAVLALRGQMVQPKIFESQIIAGDSVELAVEANSRNWQLIIDAMKEVVHGSRGTARAIGTGIDYRIAGKTGTAQVYQLSQDDQDEEQETVAKALQDHALFVAFAPVDEPKLVVAVVVENGGSGSSVAAPVARQVFDHYFANQ